ncbi:hypothetical protein H6503_06190 [Candidatus Woesearchaeota archaeon]|nr:hypothetical protein [Candidatus Woesearchaeota archaeon]
MVGIDEFGIAIPKLKVMVDELAEYRGLRGSSISDELGSESMAVTEFDQDAATLAMDAACDLIDKDPEKLASIERIAVGSEDGPDDSKSIASFVQGALKERYGKDVSISKNMDVMDYTQACAGSTAALLDSFRWVKENHGRSALVIGSDIAKYERGTKAEYTQGAGAVAMLVKECPKFLDMDSREGRSSDSVADFWKPHGSPHAFVDGKYSVQCYLNALIEAYSHYGSRNIKAQLSKIFFHVPTPAVVRLALRKLSKNVGEIDLLDTFEAITFASKHVSNSYNASLYLNLVAGLENDRTKGKIGLYSYGSGYLSYFFSMKIVASNPITWINDRLSDMKVISSEEYDWIKYGNFNKHISEPQGWRKVSETNGMPEYKFF